MNLPNLTPQSDPLVYWVPSLSHPGELFYYKQTREGVENEKFDIKQGIGPGRKHYRRVRMENALAQ